MRLLLTNLLLALVYLVAGKLGLLMSLPPGYATAIWPAAGIAFAACLLFNGRKVWSGILLGSWCVNSSIGPQWDLGILPLIIAAGSVLQAIVGARLLRKFDPHFEMDQPIRILQFSGSGLLACTIASSIANTALFFKGYLSADLLAQNFSTWWLGDALGVLIFTPLCIALYDKRPAWRERRWMVVTPLLLTFSSFICVYLFIRNSEIRQIQSQFATESITISQDFEQLDAVNTQTLSNLATLAQLVKPLSLPQFSTFVKQSNKAATSFRTFGWAPLLRHAPYDHQYKQLQQTLNLNNIKIHRLANWQPNPLGVLPLTMISPPSPSVLGLDLLSEPRRAQTANAVIASHKVAISPKILLSDDLKGPGGLLMMAPVLSATGEVESIVTGVIDIRGWLKLMQQHKQVQWAILDLTEGKTEVIYSNFTKPFPSFQSSSQLDAMGVYYQQPLNFANRQWQLLLHKPTNALGGSTISASLVLLFCILTATAVLGNLALILSADRRRVAAEVEIKTLVLQQEMAIRKQQEIQLIEAKQQAESANLAKSQFLATMSHEIRTPLNGVMGMAQLLMQEQVDETERLDYAQTILRSGENLLSLLNEILDFSKVEAGKMELESLIFQPAELVQEVANLFRETAHQRGLQLDLLFDVPLHLSCWGDPYRLRQIISNLLSNALKFTSAGTITLKLEQLENSFLKFTVADTGDGIDELQISKLFKTFSQGDGSITRRYGGTGLGLAICRSLIQLMGGEIGVISQLGKGSQFWFQIPVDEATDSEKRLPTQYQALATQAEQTKLQRILVVEDNPINQVVVLAMLARLGYQTELAQHGQEALDALKSTTSFDLVLMDCQMPIMDGYEASLQIRSWEQQFKRKHIPIIALTADAYQEDKERCQAVGMDDFLSKPISIHDLAETLQRCLSPRLASSILGNSLLTRPTRLKVSK
ncbi:ATP-binding protein [Iodobacter sp.]|uniref:ATP-binding protein n=1 Tax=Iodobacter sp. TaxID=1915058 RepID=UPI0025CEBD0B|nr:ATP-binding protein [Iodobacter sp.]